MTRPGEIAMLTYRCGQCVESGPGTWTGKGWDVLDPGVGFLLPGDVIDSRPMVLIDTEDMAQIERLAKAVVAAFPKNFVGLDPDDQDQIDRVYANAMQIGLHSLLSNPKPEEPTGRFAVVVDDKDREWVRGHDGNWHHSAAKGKQPYSGWIIRTWDKVDAVEVLAPGVTSR